MNTSAPLAYTSFCEFFVWITKECHLERIAFDPAFWEVQVQKTKSLFNKVIMPELIGKYFTKLMQTRDLREKTSVKHCYAK